MSSDVARFDFVKEMQSDLASPELGPRLEVLAAATDDRGTLIEVSKAGVPGHAWRRAFILSTTAPAVRGGHAHKLCSQALIAIAGGSVVRSRGPVGELEFHLSSTTEALVVPPMNWLDIEMSQNATLLVLADREYESEDYIRDFDEFTTLVSRHRTAMKSVQA